MKKLLLILASVVLSGTIYTMKPVKVQSIKETFYEPVQKVIPPESSSSGLKETHITFEPTLEKKPWPEELKNLKPMLKSIGSLDEKDEIIPARQVICDETNQGNCNALDMTGAVEINCTSTISTREFTCDDPTVTITR